jgi:glycosyltransferase involved in cell wall biosynthesis
LLDPRWSAGDVALFDEMSALSRLGCSISFSAPELMGRTSPEGSWLAGKGIARLISTKAHRAAAQIVKKAGPIDVAYLSFWNVARIYLPHIREYFPNSKIVFNPVDLHFLRAERGERFGIVPTARMTFSEMKDRELSVIAQADVTLVYSDVEKRILSDLLPQARVEICPWMLPTRPNSRRFDERHTITFLGNFAHPPNVDAAHFIGSELLPELRRRGLDREILVFGRQALAKLEGLEYQGLSIRGELDELDSMYSDCRVSIAPLRYGAGKKGKVAQAMVRGVPTVLSTVAAEGFGLTSGVEAIIADGAAETADAIIRLYRSEELWTSVSSGALAYSEANFNPAVGQAFFRDLLRSLS